MTAKQTEKMLRLARVLREITYDAGFAMVHGAQPEALAFLTIQYNNILRYLTEAMPLLADRRAPLPADASSAAIRMAARSLAAYLEERFAPKPPRPMADWLEAFLARHKTHFSMG